MHEPSTGEKGGAGVDGVTRLLCENPLPPSPKQSTLLVTRTLSKAHSLAGFRVGYAILPVPVADDLNASNDTYPLARPSQAAAIATLRADAEIRNRIERLRSWTERLAEDLETLGVTTYPTETYLFLADFSPHDASDVAARSRERDIVIEPLVDDRLGPGYVRVTTARPEDNERVVEALRRILYSELRRTRPTWDAPARSSGTPWPELGRPPTQNP